MAERKLIDTGKNTPFFTKDLSKVDQVWPRATQKLKQIFSFELFQTVFRLYSKADGQLVLEGKDQKQNQDQIHSVAAVSAVLAIY